MIVDPAAFLALAKAQGGKPYVYGSKGPDTFDCSGLVTWVIHELGGPDWRDTHNAQKLYDILAPAVGWAKDGEILLAFYSPARGGSHIEHVMISVGDGRAFGACGGDSTTLTVEEAHRVDAKVRFRDSVAYRQRLAGLRYLVLAEESHV